MPFGKLVKLDNVVHVVINGQTYRVNSERVLFSDGQDCVLLTLQARLVQ